MFILYSAKNLLLFNIHNTVSNKSNKSNEQDHHTNFLYLFTNKDTLYELYTLEMQILT